VTLHHKVVPPEMHFGMVPSYTLCPMEVCGCLLREYASQDLRESVLNDYVKWDCQRPRPGGDHMLLTTHVTPAVTRGTEEIAAECASVCCPAFSVQFGQLWADWG
jgi:hypothetical protein